MVQLAREEVFSLVEVACLHVMNRAVSAAVSYLSKQRLPECPESLMFALGS